ncbi:hypothetical protein K7X08_028994 [Anisodus acutangulus]|uniref:PPM-type phosphatase domain-containing protein n=1 Tax=Anisodus acutangulus TaxID=402998 RepID=A0A9Q1QTC6_9SOLA|nr:hypothetical protein K7X08_028994 [Anisodus acutangulus]
MKSGKETIFLANGNCLIATDADNNMISPTDELLGNMTCSNSLVYERGGTPGKECTDLEVKVGVSQTLRTSYSCDLTNELVNESELVANYCHERLHMALAQEIDIMKEDSNNGSVGWKEKWSKVLLNCFCKVDDEVGGFCSETDGIEPDLSAIAPEAVGSTAVVAVVSPTHIIIANCGDSRAVLCRAKVPMPLYVDYKPNREDECSRIEELGGKVINWDGHHVSGVLAVSRSIGDGYLRPYVIPDPEMMFVPRVKENDCLILASDGLWDVLTNEEACDVARRRILLWHKKNGGTLTNERGESSGCCRVLDTTCSPKGQQRQYICDRGGLEGAEGIQEENVARDVTLESYHPSMVIKLNSTHIADF